MADLWVVDLGTVEYREAYAMQELVRDARQRDAVPDVLLLLEHPAVYTRGRRSDPTELPLGEDWYRARGIEIVDVDRGGRVTYHGPGQMVGYPIMRIGDVHSYVRAMERAILEFLGDHGVEARMRTAEGPDFTGVWVADRKIASIGVHVAKRVTTHGFAINIDNDLAPFQWVIPCGLDGVAMTSLAQEAPGSLAPAGTLRERMAERYAGVHGLLPRQVGRAELEAAAGAVASLS